MKRLLELKMKRLLNLIEKWEQLPNPDFEKRRRAALTGLFCIERDVPDPRYQQYARNAFEYIKELERKLKL